MEKNFELIELGSRFGESSDTRKIGCYSAEHGQLFCNNCANYFSWHNLPEECPTGREEEFDFDK